VSVYVRFSKLVWFQLNKKGPEFFRFLSAKEYIRHPQEQGSKPQKVSFCEAWKPNINFPSQNLWAEFCFDFHSVESHWF